MLLVSNISCRRSNRIIFSEVNLSLSEKKIVHITGQNGVGKTSLIKIIVNLLDPHEGQIVWNGKLLKKNFENFLKNLTFIMDINTSNESLTVLENLFFWRTIFNSNTSNKEIESLLEILNLSNSKLYKAGTLSYGQKRKLEIARLIIEKKKLWVIDEPLMGLDHEAVKLLNQTIKTHVENDGMVLFSSSGSLSIKGIETLNLDNYANY